jgi:hypothetical protein
VVWQLQRNVKRGVINAQSGKRLFQIPFVQTSTWSPQKERTVFTRHLSFHFSRLLTAPIYLLVIMLHSRTNCVTDYVVRTRILYINLSC